MICAALDDGAGSPWAPRMKVVGLHFARHVRVERGSSGNRGLLIVHCRRALLQRGRQSERVPKTRDLSVSEERGYFDLEGWDWTETRVE